MMVARAINMFYMVPPNMRELPVGEVVPQGAMWFLRGVGLVPVTSWGYLHKSTHAPKYILVPYYNQDGNNRGGW